MLSSTDNVLSLSFATIRSGSPSPLTSATVTEAGLLPAAKVCGVPKLIALEPGAVVLSMTETVPDGFWFAAIRSGRPSPLTSAIVTEDVLTVVPKICAPEKLGGIAPGAVVLTSTDIVPP